MASSDDATVTVELLQAMKLFAELEEPRLEKLAAIARLEHVAVGEAVVREHEPCDAVRVVVDGRVSLTLSVPGREGLVVTSVSSGQVLGWSALTSQREWMATARALKDTSLVVFPGAELLALCDADHELGYFIMRGTFTSVAQRLHDAWLQLLDMFGGS
jgi:CRP-like cAMP-binding protein